MKTAVATAVHAAVTSPSQSEISDDRCFDREATARGNIRHRAPVHFALIVGMLRLTLHLFPID